MGETDTISRQAAIDALEKVAELFPWRVPGNRDTYDRYNEAWNDAIERAEIEIEELPSAQPEQRWIPTSEKLPEYDKPVLLSTAWGKTEIGFLTQRGWMIVACSYREFEQGAVVAWMPLPEPWRGEQDDY